MPSHTLRIATRNSPLALWQANHIRQRLLQKWPRYTFDLLPMTTSGDRFLKDKLLTIGNKGLFVKELEEALLDKRADIAVHSMKDVPALFPEGLQLTTICKRDNPFDALVSEKHAALHALPIGAIIGTASLRRQSQLLATRPDLQIKTLRGNINTRIDKLKAGEFDAIVLSAAGLERMGMHHFITELLSDEVMLPACGQGALGIECRTQDDRVQQLLLPLNDEATTTCVLAERQVSRLLGGNCHTPLAVYCAIDPASNVVLRATIVTTDGKTCLQDRQQGASSEVMTLAEQCAQNLIKQGALDLLA